MTPQTIQFIIDAAIALMMFIMGVYLLVVARGRISRVIVGMVMIMMASYGSIEYSFNGQEHMVYRGVMRSSGG